MAKLDAMFFQVQGRHGGGGGRRSDAGRGPPGAHARPKVASSPPFKPRHLLERRAPAGSVDRPGRRRRDACVLDPAAAAAGGGADGRVGGAGVAAADDGAGRAAGARHARQRRRRCPHRRGFRFQQGTLARALAHWHRCTDASRAGLAFLRHWHAYPHTHATYTIIAHGEGMPHRFRSRGGKK